MISDHDLDLRNTRLIKGESDSPGRKCVNLTISDTKGLYIISPIISKAKVVYELIKKKQKH